MPIAKGYQFDIQGRFDSQWKFFEIYHRHPRSTIVITETIRKMKATQPNGQMVFVFTSRPEEDVLKILEENNVEAVHLNDLFNRHFIQQNSQLIHWYIKSVLPDIKKAAAQPGLFFEGAQLIKRLQQCATGEQSWSSFEQVGSQLFKFLFADNFRTYLAEMQSENSLKNHRRDLIVSNNYRSPGSFWAEVKDQFGCAAIIIDFKNYSEPLSANTLFNTSKYLTKGVGNFAIVFSRKGLDNSAMKEQHALFRQERLVIEFSDEELIEMVQEKMIGKDPIDRLDSKNFN